MKEIIFTATIFCAVCLASCERNPAIPTDPLKYPLFRLIDRPSGMPVEIWVDRETGCQYFFYDGRAGMQPRIDADGQHYCTAKKI